MKKRKGRNFFEHESSANRIFLGVKESPGDSEVARAFLVMITPLVVIKLRNGGWPSESPRSNIRSSRRKLLLEQSYSSHFLVHTLFYRVGYKNQAVIHTNLSVSYITH